MNCTLLTGPGPVTMVVFPAYPPDSWTGGPTAPPVRHRHPADQAVVGVTMARVQATPAGTGRVRERATCG